MALNSNQTNNLFGNYVGRIFPIELEIKDTTETESSASYLDFHLEIYRKGGFRTKLYDKRYDFDFSIAYFPFMSSHIPVAPAFGVQISQLIPTPGLVLPIRIFLIEGCS